MRVLIAYSHFSSYVNTTSEYLKSFSKLKGTDVYYTNVVRSGRNFFDLTLFDVVIVSYCARLCIPNYVDPVFLDALKNFTGIKIVCIQDEYDNVNFEVEQLAYIGVDLILTCVPPESWRYVYSAEKLPNVKFCQVLTGYASSKIPLAKLLKSRQKRQIFIGYRGRKISSRYGALGDLKFEIGVRVKQYAMEHGHRNIDIEWTEDKRIYGRNWNKWLSSVQTTLVTESGSNVFDFDGRITKEIEDAKQANRGVSDEICQLIAVREREICMNQISPRVFEAIGNGCNIIAFEGNYSDILFPWKHYLPLKKDYSNIDEIFKFLQDERFMNEMFLRAYSEVVLAKNNTYEGFIDLVSTQIGKLVKEKNISLSTDKQLSNIDMHIFSSEPCVYRLPLHTRFRIRLSSEIRKIPPLYWTLRYLKHYSVRPKDLILRLRQRVGGIQ